MNFAEKNDMNPNPYMSVVIPAHNEENYIAACLESVKRAAVLTDGGQDGVEIVVSANRCTDGTAEIARRFGAEVVTNDDRSIARVRNAGVSASRGDIVVTIDADSVMSEHALCEVAEMLKSGKYLGGGTRVRFERMSPGIFFCQMPSVVFPSLLVDKT